MADGKIEIDLLMNDLADATFDKFIDKAKQTYTEAQKPFDSPITAHLEAEAKDVGIKNFGRMLDELPKEKRTELMAKAQKAEVDAMQKAIKAVPKEHRSELKAMIESGKIKNFSELIRQVPVAHRTKLEAAYESAKVDGYHRLLKSLPASMITKLDIDDHATPKLRQLKREAKEVERGLGTVKKVGLGTFIGGLGVNVATKAIGAFTGAVGGAIKRVDTLNNSGRTFENLNISAKDAEKGMKKVNEAIDGLPTALDDAVSGVTLLTASTKDMDKSVDIFKAVNDTVLGFGGSADNVNSAVTQMSKAFSAGKISGDTLNSMLENGMGPIMDEVAKKMGMTYEQMTDAASKGTIDVKKFQDALIDLDKNGSDSIKSMEQIAADSTKGIATSMQNAKSAVTRSVGAIIEGMAPALVDMFDMIKNTLNAMKPIFVKVGETIGKALPKVIDVFKMLGGVIGAMAGQIKNSLMNISMMFGAMFKDTKGGFGDMLKSIGPVLEALGKFVGVIVGSAFEAFAIVVGWIAKAFSDTSEQAGNAKMAMNFTEVTKIIERLTGVVQGLWTQFSMIMQPLGEIVGVMLGGAFEMFAWLIGDIAKAFGLMAGESKGAQDDINGLAQFLEKVAEHRGKLKVLGYVIGGITASLGLYKLALMSVRGAMAVATTATKVMTGAQRALNLVMKANPFVLVVSLIVGIGLALYELYKHNAKFKKFVDDAWKLIKKFTGDIFKGIGKFFGGIVKGVKDGIGKIGKGIKDSGKAISKAWNDLWSGTGKFFSKTWKGMKDGTKKGMDNIGKNMSKAGKNIKSNWNNNWKEIGKFSEKTWNATVRGSKKGMDGIKSNVSNIGKAIGKNWNDTWSGIGKFFEKIWKGILKFVDTYIKNVKNVIKTVTSLISKIWKGDWEGVGKIFENVWKTIKKVAKNSIDWVGDTIGNVVGGISKTWDKAWNGMADAFDKIWSKIKNLAKDGMNGVIGVINMGIKGINGVISTFGGSKETIKPLAKVNKFATGTNGAPRGLAMVNDGFDSPTGQELIIDRHGNPHMLEGRNRLVMFEGGETVVPAHATHAMLNGMGVNKFAKGTGGWFNSAASFFGDMWDDLKGVVGKATGKAKDFLGILGNPVGYAKDKFLSPVMSGVNNAKGGANQAFGKAFMDKKAILGQADDWWGNLWKMAKGAIEGGGGTGAGDDYLFKNKWTKDGADPWGYFYRQCVSFVASRLKNAGVKDNLFSNLGDGQSWINAPVAKSKTPKVGTVAVYGPDSIYGNAIGNPHGHVSVVTGVGGGGFTEEGYNMNNNQKYYNGNRVKNLKGITFLDFGKNLAGGDGDAGKDDNPIQKMIRKQTGGFLDWVGDTIGGLMNVFVPGGDQVPGAGGQGVMSRGSFDSTAKRAARKSGESLSKRDLDQLWSQAMHESTANPGAVQGAIGDINNITGDLAKGLFQWTGATWREWAHPKHRNIFSAFDQFMAVFNVANWRRALAPTGVKRGWGPNGYGPKRFADGGWGGNEAGIFNEVPGQEEMVINPHRGQSDDHIEQVIAKRATLSPESRAARLNDVINMARSGRQGFMHGGYGSGGVNAQNAMTGANNVSGDVTIVTQLDSDTIATATYPKIKLLQDRDVHLTAQAKGMGGFAFG